MPKPSGDYTSVMTWLKFIRTDKTYQPQYNVRASISDLSADEVIALNLKHSTTDCRIRIREFHDISAKDRLQDLENEAIYDITGISKGDSELLVDAKRMERTI